MNPFITAVLLTAIHIPIQAQAGRVDLGHDKRGNVTTMLFRPAYSQCDGKTRSIATNFAEDIKGTPDDRNSTWGDAGYIVKKVTFKPPAGCLVRITRVYGDFLIWPIGKVEPGKFAGTLLGLQTSAPEGSIFADLAADNTFLYIQVATGGGPERAAFDFKTEAGGLLGPDHAMLVKMAVWLNDTGLVIHMEPSFVAEYHFEQIQQ